LLAINCCHDVAFLKGSKAIRAVCEVAAFSVPVSEGGIGRITRAALDLGTSQVPANPDPANPASFDVKR
jgi:hypothetical protein